MDFIFPNRLHRLAYFLRGVTTDIVAGFIYAFSGTNASNGWLVLSFVALAVYQLFYIILPRIRDIGMGSLWLLLVLVPGANVVFGIILLFRAPVILSSQSNPAPLSAPSFGDEQGPQRIGVVDNEIQAGLIDTILTERGIPHIMETYHDSAYDGLFQTQKGWGTILAAPRFSDEIVAALEEIKRQSKV